MVYQGSCHCGQVTFKGRGTIDSALSCNCSMCARKGSLLWFVPRSDFELQTSEDAAATYTFNTHTIKHRFCKNCGIAPFGYGVHPEGFEMAGINLRCIEDLDLASISVQYHDGKSV
jgi:hypothetical protein